MLRLVALLNLSSVFASTTKSWTISHRLLNANDVSDAWTVRGTIELTIDPEAGDSKNEEPSIAISNEPIQESFASSVQHDAALYQMKLGDNILTTVPACHLRRSNFRDELVLNLNDQAELLSLSYHPIISPLAPKSCGAYESPLSGEKAFESKISFETAVSGMVVGKPIKDGKSSIKPPPGYKWLPGPKSKGAAFDATPKEEQKPPQGPFEFMKRYWYIFLPVLLMNLLGSEAPPAQAKEEGEGGEQQTKRRGKKG